ncbi:hypothetical protein AAKU64_003090 [Undibacterium sp. GrIS 1.8]|uniref:hypothetical protein n=1 Tax=unclassified Undibacterium TaxID=2630295 RepID=UPI003391A58B
MKFIAIALTLVTANIFAAPLPECDLSGATAVQNFQSSPQLIGQPEFIRKLTNTSVRTISKKIVAKGDAILVSDLELIQRDVSLSTQQPFKYSANLLAVSFSYNPTSAQTALYRFKANSGDIYHVLMYKQDAVFVREDGMLCDRVVRYSSDSSSIVAYTYQTYPEDVKFTFGKADHSWGVGSLRIIYNGVTSGSIQFQEVWIQDGKILSTTAHQLDQFTKDVRIAGFPIRVDSVTGDSAAISLDAADELSVSLGDARLISRYLKK